MLNESGEPMPLGTGFHPYFTLADEARATVHAAAVWHHSAASNGLPMRREAVAQPLHFDFQRDTLPDETLTWFCETGPAAHATIDFPGANRRIILTSLHARHLVVHYRAGERFLCLEPSSHLAGMLDPVHDVALPQVPVEFTMRLRLE